MTTKRIDWSGASAVVAGAVFAGAGYVLALVLLFGPMAHAVVQLS